jgi:DNA modification methylase
MHRSAPSTSHTHRIELWPTARPIPYQRNPRICGTQAVTKVAASIAEFGFRSPILVDGQGVIIAGHTRLLAARQLGLEQVPVIVCDDLAPDRVQALRLADNRTAQETSWNDELLALEIADLAGGHYDLDLLGFEPLELARLMAPQGGLTDPDAVPEPPVTPTSEPGDLWIMGDHRLLCGDSTQPHDVVRVMDGKRATLMVTDPPYLCNYDGGNRPQSWASDGRRISSEDKTRHWDDYVDHESSVTFYKGFLSTALACALHKAPVVYQWFAMTRTDIVMEAWRASGLLPHQVVIWHKSRPVLGRSWFLYDYEPAMVGWVKGSRPRTHPPNDARAVWDVEQGEGTEAGAGHDHPTMKPVELLRRPIDWHTTPGSLIYEPFCGSGTALIAAEMAGRRCYAIELSPVFCDVAVRRWQAFTGKEAMRHGASH